MLKIKISHHKHSGHLRPHEYTSYGPLALLLMAVGLVLTMVTASAASGPGSGSVGLTGIMPGIPPTTAATISAPTNQQHFTISPVTVSGTCPDNTLVELYKNDIFAGSTTCSSGGSYSLNVDLLIGTNTLIARVYDALNQAGPDSNAVTIYYDALPTQAASITPLNLGGAQLILNTDAVYRGVFPGQPLNISISLLGGTPPFAINVQWGDGTNKITPRNDNLTFTVSHIYNKPGTYQITIQADDGSARVAYISVAAIVNGQPTITAALSANTAKLNKVLALWPLFTAILAMVISFWLGERREKHVLVHANLKLHPQV